MAKRNFEEHEDKRVDRTPKKAVIQSASSASHFRQALFDRDVVEHYCADYVHSEPYKHAVVSDLVNPSLLRSVRTEIKDNIHFKPKETDIYKIHQSGDLANLSGLPASAISRLPSLLQLRDALYSPDFRSWISEVSQAGALSGSKTDMAVNVYAPGCHLLCHDDVIGSRRVSYILYLTDPDRPWKAEWGGALRLYPTQQHRGTKGEEVKLPSPEWSKTIPPAWNQLAFFAVQPGESFHDVEEVYRRVEAENEDDGGRIRMAISGWYHIPQEGEDGYEPGLEERLAERSSLQQLQGKQDQLDLPQPQWWDYDNRAATNGSPEYEEEVGLSEQDLDFLLKYMKPHYLTPDTVDELSALFAEESSLRLSDFLNDRFAASLRPTIEAMEHDCPSETYFQAARPPHKQRYQYRQSSHLPTTDKSGNNIAGENPYTELLDIFLPSLAFRKWLSLATGLGLRRSNIIARCFRRGLDYTLATGYEDENAQLEFCLDVTPTQGWGGEDPEASTKENDAEHDSKETNGASKSTGTARTSAESGDAATEEDNVGGYELYMAGDDAADSDDEGSDHGVSVPSNVQSQTGAGERRSAKQKKQKKSADPAIYQASGDDEDDGILFSNPASWNTMSIVLRDKGVLKFMKYVSKAAKGDRWDYSGAFEVEPDDGDTDDSDGKEDNGSEEGNDGGEESGEDEKDDSANGTEEEEE
ncbi:putative component of NuA3 histone acetyltransferase complex [Elasticomyces elasticus]|nr:putative component of NuA3 histone acetyltransferase complex [Elasticomyces elasticus]